MHPRCVDVGAVVGVVGRVDLLGRHVAGRAQRLAGHRLAAAAGALVDAGPHAQRLRQAPVEHVHLAEVADHHVGRLEVTVHDAARVRVVDGEAHLPQEPQQPCPREVPGGEDLLQRATRDTLHGEELAAVLVGPQVVHGDDGRVLQLSLQARLAEEARAGHAQRRALRRQRLHGDVAAEPAVALEVNLAHAAAAEQAAFGVARSVGRDARGGDIHGRAGPADVTGADGLGQLGLLCGLRHGPPRRAAAAASGGKVQYAAVERN
jgi:hypothetical protein